MIRLRDMPEAVRRKVFEQADGRKVRQQQPKRGAMNKYESLYAQTLEAARMAGEVERFEFEPCGLRLADRTFYHPDFLVKIAGRLEFHEVKGFWRDDARVKIKVAARVHGWWAKFVAVTRHGGAWKREEF